METYDAATRSRQPPSCPPSERRRAGRDPPMKGPLRIGNHTITAATRIRQLASRPPPARRRARCPADVVPCAQSSSRPRREFHGAVCQSAHPWLCILDTPDDAPVFGKPPLQGLKFHLLELTRVEMSRWIPSTHAHLLMPMSRWNPSTHAHE